MTLWRTLLTFRLFVLFITRMELRAAAGKFLDGILNRYFIDVRVHVVREVS